MGLGKLEQMNAKKEEEKEEQENSNAPMMFGGMMGGMGNGPMMLANEAFNPAMGGGGYAQGGMGGGFPMQQGMGEAIHRVVWVVDSHKEWEEATNEVVWAV